MEIPKRLIDCLNENKVRYEILHHPEAITAQRIAQAEHVKARHHAKVVMIKSGSEHLMAALPADHQIDLEKRLAKPPRWTRNQSSSRYSQIARSERCRPLAISTVCRPMWTSV